ncbi:MAG: SPOR domain-containing protein [Bdellovibrionales bacterium]|nr:SPOR domain-containing protein [Bdellovibrionales bacterium]
MKKDGASTPGKKESRLEKVIVTLLVVLVSLLSFSVGIISGKGLSDKEYALKSLDKKYSHAMNDDTDAHDEVPGSGELSEEEIQQLAKSAIENAESEGHGEKREVASASGHHGETAAPAEKHEVAHGAAATEKHDAHSEKHEAAPQHKQVAHGMPVEDDRSPSSVAKKAAATEYTVQVASYESLKDAENMAGSLIKKGYPAFPFKTEINGKTWYRVSIGSFKNKKEAMTYQSEIGKQGVVKDSIVQKLTR